MNSMTREVFMPRPLVDDGAYDYYSFPGAYNRTVKAKAAPYRWRCFIMFFSELKALSAASNTSLFFTAHI